jgi:hypothetical protein
MTHTDSAANARWAATSDNATAHTRDALTASPRAAGPTPRTRKTQRPTAASMRTRPRPAQRLRCKPASSHEPRATAAAKRMNAIIDITVTSTQPRRPPPQPATTTAPLRQLIPANRWPPPNPRPLPLQSSSPRGPAVKRDGTVHGCPLRSRSSAPVPSLTTRRSGSPADTSQSVDATLLSSHAVILGRRRGDTTDNGRAPTEPDTTVLSQPAAGPRTYRPRPTPPPDPANLSRTGAVAPAGPRLARKARGPHPSGQGQPAIDSIGVAGLGPAFP